MKGEITKDTERCPFRDRCPTACLGDTDEEWIPKEGFIALEDGVLCLDWDVVVPVETEQICGIWVVKPNKL